MNKCVKCKDKADLIALMQAEIIQLKDDLFWRSNRLRDVGNIITTLGALYEASRGTGQNPQFRVRQSTLKTAWKLCGGGTEGGFYPYLKRSKKR